MGQFTSRGLLVAFVCLASACSPSGEGEADGSLLGTHIQRVTVASGEQIEITSDMICAQTTSPLPPDTLAVPNAATDSLILYREVEGGYAVASTVTCTCESGSGGCSPFEGGGQTGCIMTSCNQCKKSGGGQEVELGKTSSPQVVIRPVSDLAQSCKPITEEYERAYRDFLTAVYGANYEEMCEEAEARGAAEHTWVMVDIGGFASVTRLPSSILPPQLAGTQTSVMTTCTCNSGGSCPKKSQWPCGTMCDASNCQSCTMSLTAEPPKE